MQISNKSKVALIVNNPPENGGAHTFESSFVKTLQSVDSEEFYFEVLYSDFGSRFLKKYKPKDKSLKTIKVTLLIKLRLLIEMSLFLSSLLSRISIFELKIEKKLKKEFDAVIFLSPNPLALLLKSVPLITTVWDLGHRELPYLPEFQIKNNFNEREFYFQQTIPRSMFVLVDSEITKKSIVDIFGATPNRVLVTGLLPQKPNYQLLSTEKEFPFNYIFYPAQFWSHKNHARLIAAFKEVLNVFPDLKLLLSGSDKGELKKIQKLIKDLNLVNQVEYLGFLTRERYWNLLNHCELMVYPSLLGPTNIPPFEATIIGKKIVVSDFHRSHLEAAEVTATYFNPNSIESISSGIIEGLYKVEEISSRNFNSINQSVIEELVEKLRSLI